MATACLLGREFDSLKQDLGVSLSVNIEITVVNNAASSNDIAWAICRCVGVGDKAKGGQHYRGGEFRHGNMHGCNSCRSPNGIGRLDYTSISAGSGDFMSEGRPCALNGCQCSIAMHAIA